MRGKWLQIPADSISSPNQVIPFTPVSQSKSHVAKGSPSVCWNCFPKLTKSTWVYGQYVVNSVTSGHRVGYCSYFKAVRKIHTTVPGSLCCFFQQIETHCLHYLFQCYQLNHPQLSVSRWSPGQKDHSHMVPHAIWWPLASFIQLSLWLPLTGRWYPVLFFFCGDLRGSCTCYCVLTITPIVLLILVAQFAEDPV